MKLTELSIKKAKTLLKNKEISCLDLVNLHIKEIEEAKKLNCFISHTFESAIEEAKKSDNKPEANKRSLEGIPITFKDNFCIENTYTTAGSKYLGNFLSPYNSTIYENLCHKGGAISLAKNNMDNFALGSSNKSSVYGYCINPWKRSNSDAELVPGGSSGGSAASVAADLTLASVGSDTGGSVRQPASFCGVVGLKPSYGLISRYGLIAFSSSLDTVGLIGKNVEDAALLMDFAQEYDSKDSTSVKIQNIQYSKNITNGIKNLKIGIIFDEENTTDSIKNNIKIVEEAIKQSGAESVYMKQPRFMKYALNVYYILAPSECFSNFARFDGIKYGYQEKDCKSIIEMSRLSRQNGLGPEIKRRSMIGAFSLSNLGKEVTGINLYEKATQVRQLIKSEFEQIFKTVNAIVMPTTVGGAFGINEKLSPIDEYMNDFYTVIHNIANIPSISIPISLDKSGLPTSLQISTKYMNDELMLQVAYELEQRIQFKNKPNIWWK